MSKRESEVILLVQDLRRKIIFKIKPTKVGKWLKFVVSSFVKKEK